MSDDVDPRLVKRDSVEHWLEDAAAFCYQFQRYSFGWHHAVGADIELLDGPIKVAHAEWVSTVRDWQAEKFQTEAESLSYTKILAILLTILCRTRYVGEMKKFQPMNRPEPEFAGTPEQKQEMLGDLLGAPEAVTAFQFCISTLNFYEERRIDRRTPFAFRMTEAGRHDLLVLLTGEHVDLMGVYLALEGLYARD